MAAALGAAALCLAPVRAATPIFVDGQLLESKESHYNNIFVYKRGTYVSLTFGYNRRIYTESSYNTADPAELPVVYTRYMTLGLAYAARTQSVLEIGFGGGRTSWYLHKAVPGAAVTSVELDPEVVRIAHKYFGIRDEPNFTVVNRDGRLFLSEDKKRYDIVLIDAYRGPFVPFHLLTKEFYQLVAEHLAEGGVVLQNVEPSTMLFDAAAKTIGSVFPNVEFYPAEGNVVTVAYPGPRKSDDALARVAAARQAALHPHYDLSDLLKQRRLLPPGSDTVDPDAKVLTDDFAPVESLKAIDRHNRKWPSHRP